MKLITSDWGQEGIELVETELPDAVLLDLKLPDINGLEVIKSIRLFSAVPIMVLTVDSTEATVVQALELGANEYVFEPFPPYGASRPCQTHVDPGWQCQ